MKRITAVCALLVSALLCVFSASTVSWEGRAAVGSSGIFPGRGMYGLSRVFSVGEIVEVYNPVNQTKITVVISNNTDLSGILILLSPEAADALGITAGSDSVVRVSKIPDYALEPTYGNDAYVSPSADPDISPESAVAAAVQSETDVEKTAVEESNPPISVEEITSSVPEEKPEIPVIAQISAPEAEKTPSAEPESTPEPEHLPESEPKAEMEPEIISEPQPEQPPEDALAVVAAEIPSDPDVPPSPQLSELEVPSVLIPAEPELDESTETYTETITYSLLPAEENPPQPMPKEENSVLPPAAEPSVAAVPLTPAVPVNPLAQYEKTLQSGAWYVQLAYLKDTANIQSITVKYEKKYPLVLNKLEDGYQVLVGPLSASEYSAVLNQFKNSGFKDAFAKKIK